MEVNQHGLARSIPAAIKRTVRQKCKFGCVVCRSAFFHYDHFDPEFKDAHEHSLDGICCLCPTCHQEVTSGRYSRQLIKKRVLEISESTSTPITPPLDLHDGTECLAIGGIRYDMIPINLIKVYGETLLAVSPRSNYEPGSITGKFYSDSGMEALRILRNEVIFRTENWDIEASGRSVKIRSAPGQVCLDMEITPPKGIVVKKIDMSFADIHIFANQHAFCVGKRISEGYYFWMGAEIKVINNRFRGTAIRVDTPAALADEWNSAGIASARPPNFAPD